MLSRPRRVQLTWGTEHLVYAIVEQCLSISLPHSGLGSRRQSYKYGACYVPSSPCVRFSGATRKRRHENETKPNETPDHRRQRGSGL